MLHLIAKGLERLLPARLHRALLPLAHRIRHSWRIWRKADIHGCCVVITNSAGEMLMLRHSYGPAVWAFPGGGIDKGEAPDHAAIREVQEELGIMLETVEPVAVLKEEVSGSPQTAHIFTAISDAQPQPDQREVIAAAFFPANNLPGPIGRITASRLAVWCDWARTRQSSES
jgi:ADP-ribose pyrophosphatase YjhB (NUDIX family)